MHLHFTIYSCLLQLFAFERFVNIRNFTYNTTDLLVAMAFPLLKPWVMETYRLSRNTQMGHSTEDFLVRFKDLDEVDVRRSFSLYFIHLHKETNCCHNF